MIVSMFESRVCGLAQFCVAPTLLGSFFSCFSDQAFDEILNQLFHFDEWICLHPHCEG